MAIKFLNDIESSGEIQGTSLDINGVANITAAAGTSHLLTLHNTSNASGASINFSDVSNATQTGTIGFLHADSASQGGGSSFHVTSTEADMVLVVGGRVAATAHGSNSEVDYGFVGDIDTGMMRSGANALRFVAGGTTVADIGAGQFTVTGEVQATSLDINGNADVSGNITSSTSSTIGTPKIIMQADGTLDWGAAKDYGTLTWDTGYALIDGQSGKGIKFRTNGSSLALTLDTSQNATFAGNVVPAGITLDGNTITGIDDSSEFTDDDAHIMTSAAINDKFAPYNWVNSRGENLFSNGSGLLGDITNMPGFTFDGSHANNSPGSFKWTGTGTPFTSEFIPVDASRKYKMQYDAKTENGVGRYYGMTTCFDVDGNGINASNHMYRANTLTTLAVQLVNGATTMTLTDSANWNNAGTAGVSNHLRSLIRWDYANSFGYTYPEETYSRNYLSQAWDPGDINFTTHVITLRVAWAGGTIAAGTKVSNGSSGGTYKYNVMSNKLLTTDWVRQTGYMDGVDYSGTNNSSKFPPGTAKIKLGWLMNYQNLQEGEVAWFTNINVGVSAHEDDEIADAVERATDSNTFKDADHTKLNAIEASADVTDAANVTAAGALMKTGGTMSGAIAMGSQNITGGGAITGTTLTGTSLDINGDADISGTTTLDGNVLAKNRLTVGQSSVNGSYGLYAAGTLGVGGNATFAGNVTAGSNSLTAGSLDINGNADISGALTLGTALAAAEGGTGLTSISTLLNSNVTSVSGNAGTVTINSDFTGTYPLLVEVTNSGVIYNNPSITYNGSSDTLTSPNFSGNLTGNVTGNVTGSSGSCTGLASQATNLNATDDRNMAPEDYAYSDDFRVFFSSKEGLEDGSTGGTNYQDVLYMNSYNDSSGGDANVLAFDKSEKAIYHYQADQAATNWGTAKQLAYTDSDISGDTTGNAATVTTNANLTGHITSSGNAAVLGSFTVAQLSAALSNASISGNNTGDQTLPTDFVSAANGGTFSGAITSTGKIQGAELEGTSLDINGRVDFQAISTGSTGTVVRGGFLNPAAEASMVHIPHIINDLAGFNKWSNSTITVTGLYKTRGGSSGSYTYSNAVAESDFDGGAAFDAHSSTAGSWYSDNGVDGSTAGVGVITLEWTNELTYSSYVGIVFGAVGFSPQRVKIEAYQTDAGWQTLCDITDNSENVVLRQINGNSGAGQGTTKLRYTLGGSINGSYFRIHTLYAANYKAGNNSLNNTSTANTQGVNFLERYKDGYLHGNLYPGADDTYDLGSGTWQWKDAYFDGTVNADALDIDGNADISGSLLASGAVRLASDVQVGDTVSLNAYGAFQVNQTADNDEEGIAVMNSSGSRSIRIYCDGSDNSVINSGDGGGQTLKLNEGSGKVVAGGELEAASLDINGAADISGAVTLGSTLDITASTSNQDLFRLSHPTAPTDAGFMIGFNTDGTTNDNVISMGVEYSATDYDVINIQRSTRNVGIGTVSPNQLLEIKKTSGEVAVRLHADHTSVPSAVIEFMRGTSDTWGGDAYTDWKIGALSTADFAITSKDTTRGEIERLTIDYASGNVGIGTVSPSEKLEVVGKVLATANSTALAAGYFATLSSDYATNALKLTSKNGDVFRATNFGKDVAILTGDSTTTEKMRILANGNVGIGTTTPGEALDVVGNIAVSGTVDGVDVAAAGTLATNAMPKSGGAFTGAVTTNNTIDGRQIATDGGKLDTIAENATVDQTVTDSTSTTSSTIVASATAVKAAYDRGTTGITDAADAQTTADDALPTAGGTMSGAIAMGSQNITGAGSIGSGPITSTSTITADTYFESSDAAVVLAPTGAGTCYLRPNGVGSGTGAFSVGSSGKATVGGALEATSLDINGNADITGRLTVGVNDAGHDVIFYGNTANKKVMWDTSVDHLKLYDDTKIVFGTGGAEADYDGSIYWDQTDLVIDSESDLQILSDAIVTGDVTATGAVTAKTYDYISCGYYDNIGTSLHYLPLNGKPSEQASDGNAYTDWVAPCHTTVKSIQIRFTSIIGSGDLTMTVWKDPIGSGTKTSVESETVSVTTDHNNDLIHFLFDGAVIEKVKQ